MIKSLGKLNCYLNCLISAALPMVVIPQTQTIATAAPQQRIMNLSQLPTGNVIYLTPANKVCTQFQKNKEKLNLKINILSFLLQHNNTNYITFPASQLLNAGSKQPNILQVIRLAE